MNEKKTIMGLALRLTECLRGVGVLEVAYHILLVKPICLSILQNGVLA